MRTPPFRKTGSLPRLPRAIFLFTLFSVSLALALPALAQKSMRGIDASVNAFGQFTGTKSGNGVTDRPNRSTGLLISVRQSFKPWLGYEVNWSYTRFSEAYSTYPFSVQNNLHEFTAAYLVEAPRVLFFQPFATVGSGLLFFLPTTVGGQKQELQTRTPLLYEVGVNLPLVTSHFGARIEYRGLLYKTPDFGNPRFVTGTRRQTSEPTAGIYLRF